MNEEQGIKPFTPKQEIQIGYFLNEQEKLDKRKNEYLGTIYDYFQWIEVHKTLFPDRKEIAIPRRFIKEARQEEETYFPDFDYEWNIDDY